MRAHTPCLLLLALTFAGCPPKVEPKTPTKPPTEVLTLLRLENGDRACYVVVKAADDTEKSLEGDFELCPGGGQDATALIGRKITYTTQKANVLAASCQGDMDCGKSDEVELVVSITPAE